jgi:hypothetical protein
MFIVLMYNRCFFSVLTFSVILCLLVGWIEDFDGPLTRGFPHASTAAARAGRISPLPAKGLTSPTDFLVFEELTEATH